MIDKDKASALLAAELDADVLVLATDVDAVYEGWGTPGARPLTEVASSKLRGWDFEPGFMRPKVEAACRFVEGEGTVGKSRRAAIGALAEIESVLAGSSGTQITRDA